MKATNIFNNIVVCLFTVLILSSGYCLAEEFNVTDELELQSALNDASNNGENDRINIASGVYDSSIFLGGFEFEPGDQHDLEISGDPDGNTVIDGNDMVSGLSVNLVSESSDSEIIIRNLTFRNGNGSMGGGLFVDANLADLTVENCIFDSNISQNDGGGIAVTDSINLNIIDIVFEDNTAMDDGGAVSVDAINFTVTISNSTFTNNQSPNDQGGAIFVIGDDSEINIADSTFENNSAPMNQGGGVFYIGDELVLNVENSMFMDNSASDQGGAVFLIGDDHSSEFTNNEFRVNQAGNQGGAVFVIGDLHELTFRKNRFFSNSAQGSGSEDGGAVFQITDSSTAVYDSNEFTKNTAGADGGAVELLSGDTSDTVFTNNIFDDNSSVNNGGALSLESGLGSSLFITNNTFAFNQAGVDGGGTIITLNSDTAEASIYNNIYFDNSAGNNGDDIFVNDDGDSNSTGSELNVFNNIFSQLLTNCSDLVICASESLNSGNNLSDDPQFVNAFSGDFNLSEGSPAIDSGDSGAPRLTDLDFNGNSRVDGGSPDMGAIEFDASGGGGSGCSLSPVKHKGLAAGMPLVMIAILSLVVTRRIAKY